jgi:hypothetical protein
MSNQEEMISKQLVTYFFISLEDLYRGKVFQEEAKMKNTTISKRRNKRLQLKSSVKVIPRNLENL